MDSLCGSFEAIVQGTCEGWGVSGWGGKRVRVTLPLPLQVFSWARLAVAMQCLGSVGLLATLEVVFKEQYK